MKKVKDIISEFAESGFFKKVKKITGEVFKWIFWGIIILSFMIGISGADSFMEEGKLGICLVLVFVPMFIVIIALHFDELKNK